MRRIVFALAIACAHVAAAQDCRTIAPPPLHPLRVEEPKRIQFDNGLVVLLSEDHELPLIYGVARIRGGRRDVPAGRTGLSTIYYKAWRTGGTPSMSGDALDDLLDARGASIETFCSDVSCSVTFDTLKSDFDTVFARFADLLRNPAMPQAKVDLAKTYANSAISRRNDYADDIAMREAAILGYGPDTPMARVAEYATIAAVTRDDLLAFHRRFVQPNNIVLGIVGDFDSAAMEKRLRDAFGAWPRGSAAARADIATRRAQPGVYFIEKNDVTQSSVELIGESGTTFRDPDFAAIQVLNQIISGGFSGRLMNDIRSKRGLAYSVSGGIGVDFEPPAFLTAISLGTKSETTFEAIAAARDVLVSLRNQPVTQQELDEAKQTILNRFVFTMDSPRKVLGQRMTLAFYGYPAEFWQKYPAAIRAVTVDDVTRVSRKYLHPDQLIVVVVGNPPATTLGNVTKLDVTIPPPPAK